MITVYLLLNAPQGQKHLTKIMPSWIVLCRGVSVPKLSLRTKRVPRDGCPEVSVWRTRHSCIRLKHKIN